MRVVAALLILMTSFLLTASLANVVFTILVQVVLSRHLYQVFWKNQLVINGVFLLSSWTYILSSAYFGRSHVGFGTIGGTLGLFGAVYADTLKNWKVIYRSKDQALAYVVGFAFYPNEKSRQSYSGFFYS